MRTLSAWAVVAMFTTVAAGGAGPVQKKAAKPILPTASPTEKVPVPNVAKRVVPDRKPIRDTLKTDTYRVPDMTFEEIRAWYRVHMPEGGAWGPWRCCYDMFEGRIGVGWDYYRPGSSKPLTLGVMITRDDPPGIMITLDQVGGECTAKQRVP